MGQWVIGWIDLWIYRSVNLLIRRFIARSRNATTDRISVLGRHIIYLLALCVEKYKLTKSRGVRS